MVLLLEKTCNVFSFRIVQELLVLARVVFEGAHVIHLLAHHNPYVTILVVLLHLLLGQLLKGLRSLRFSCLLLLRLRSIAFLFFLGFFLSIFFSAALVEIVA
mmetsp:Transcript_32968/g.32137  ORF Transcript_32968/g.32137 Transcript_32968/m.32137 type:complete len:102 (-) Transcript_32968:76-381(-)